MDAQTAQKINELADQYRQTLIQEMIHLTQSGMINLDVYAPESYAPAKMLITAAIARTAHVYAPRDRAYARTVKNLIKA